MLSCVSRAWSGPPARDPHPEPTPVRRGVRLAVDVGSVRVGVARSDPDGVLASPLAGSRAGRDDLDRLAGRAGRPEGRASTSPRQVAVSLAERIAPVPVRLFDERFTTTTAHAALRQGGKNSKARRNLVDAAAAAVLLQAALDSDRSTGNPPGELVPNGGKTNS